MPEARELDALVERLKAWLPGRRWFGGKGRRIRRVQFEDHATLVGDTPVMLALLEVAYAEGDAERYFVPLRAVSGGSLGGYDDALADEAACLAVLALNERSAVVPTERGGEMRFERGPAFDELRAEMRGQTARPLGVEQSNTSIVFGGTIIMKAFRRVAAGPNPDLEMSRFLASRTDFASLPRLAGAAEYRGPSGEMSSLGILQEFVRSEGDGWSYSLRALAAGELRDDSVYMQRVRVLGRVTAELHLALASDATDSAFAPEPVGSSDLAAWRVGVAARIRSATAALRRSLAGMEPEIRATAERVLAGEGRLVARADAICGLPLGALSKTRFHGDYHLGQVLRTTDGWLVLDFEGEPLRSLAERRAKHCPLKDVAGMLRSFSYARLAALRDPGGAGPAPSAELLANWEQVARAAYLDAYLARAGAEAVFLPRDPHAVRILLGAFELEKAAYELEYELNNRPDWVELPLSGLAEAAE